MESLITLFSPRKIRLLHPRLLREYNTPFNKEPNRTLMTARRAVLLFLYLYTILTLTKPIVAKFDRIRCKSTQHLLPPITTVSCRQALNTIALKPPPGLSEDFQLRLPQTSYSGDCGIIIDRKGEHGIWAIDPRSATRMFENTMKMTERVANRCIRDRRSSEGSTWTSSWLSGQHRFFDYRITVVRN